jgi:hypothetical protein
MKSPQHDRPKRTDKGSQLHGSNKPTCFASVRTTENSSDRKEKGAQPRVNHFFPADLSSRERLIAPGLGQVKAGMLEEDARSVAIGLLSPQLTAFFTSAPILASSAAVNSFSVKAVGHMTLSATH